MKYFIKSFFAILYGLVLIGCSKSITTLKSQVQYPQEYPGGNIRNEVLKEKKYSFENAEVVGYLDNPAPVYITDSDDSYNSNPVNYKSISDKDYGSGQLSQQLEPGMDGQPVMSMEKVKSKPKRMITYDGFICSRSTRPDSLIDVAVSLAESLKGYVEAHNNSSVTLRIPVDRFGDAYDSLLKTGEVINNHKYAEDITDAFSSCRGKE